MTPVRVLIVDDSKTMRGLIRANLSQDRDIAVVGEASNPLEARQAIKALNPDVMTLDVEMPHMDGLEFLEKVMRLRPFPVIMISSLTVQGASASIRGLELGAVDCIGKPTPTRPNEFDSLCVTVKSAAGAKVGGVNRALVARKQNSSAYAPDGKIVAIGASTGGVEALITIVSKYPVNCPPTVITLHLPSPFTASFAQRLDRLSDAHVSVASDGVPLEAGHVYVAPGSTTHLEITGSGLPRCRLTNGDLVNGHRPSVDTLFNSVARVCGENAVGVILTGMGRDGASGLLKMRQAGARTIGQNSATSVIYGMPKAARDVGAVEMEVPVSSVTPEILRLTTK